MFCWNHSCSLGISCSGSKQILILGRDSGAGVKEAPLGSVEARIGVWQVGRRVPVGCWGRAGESLLMEKSQLGREAGEEGRGGGLASPLPPPTSTVSLLSRYFLSGEEPVLQRSH